MLDLQLVLYCLVQIPTLYVQFLQTNFMDQLEDIDIMGEEIDLNMCSKVLFIKILQKMKEIVKGAEFYLQLMENEIMNLIMYMSRNIAFYFN